MANFPDNFNSQEQYDNTLHCFRKVRLEDKLVFPLFPLLRNSCISRFKNNDNSLKIELEVIAISRIENIFNTYKYNPVMVGSRTETVVHLWKLNENFRESNGGRYEYHPKFEEFNFAYHIYPSDIWIDKIIKHK